MRTGALIAAYCYTTLGYDSRPPTLIDEAQDALVHAELMARALTALGIEAMTPARVRGTLKAAAVI